MRDPISRHHHHHPAGPHMTLVPPSSFQVSRALLGRMHVANESWADALPFFQSCSWTVEELALPDAPFRAAARAAQALSCQGMAQEALGDAEGAAATYSYSAKVALGRLFGPHSRGVPANEVRVALKSLHSMRTHARVPTRLRSSMGLTHLPAVVHPAARRALSGLAMGARLRVCPAKAAAASACQRPARRCSSAAAQPARAPR